MDYLFCVFVVGEYGNEVELWWDCCVFGLELGEGVGVDYEFLLVGVYVGVFFIGDLWDVGGDVGLVDEFVVVFVGEVEEGGEYFCGEFYGDVVDLVEGFVDG